MSPASLGLLFGIAYVGLGILGMMPSLLMPPPADAPEITVTLLYGHWLGLFPVNVVHDAAHLAIGLWGLAAWAGVTSALRYARATTVLFAALSIMGLLPVLDTLFGVMPLYGHNVWLNALTAALAGYAGFRSAFVEPQLESDRRQNGADRRRASVRVADERRRSAGDRRSYSPRPLPAG